MPKAPPGSGALQQPPALPAGLEGTVRLEGGSLLDPLLRLRDPLARQNAIREQLHYAAPFFDRPEYRKWEARLNEDLQRLQALAPPPAPSVVLPTRHGLFLHDRKRVTQRTPDGQLRTLFDVDRDGAGASSIISIWPSPEGTHLGVVLRGEREDGTCRFVALEEDRLHLVDQILDRAWGSQIQWLSPMAPGEPPRFVRTRAPASSPTEMPARGKNPELVIETLGAPEEARPVFRYTRESLEAPAAVTLSAAFTKDHVLVDVRAQSVVWQLLFKPRHLLEDDSVPWQELVGPDAQVTDFTVRPETNEVYYATSSPGSYGRVMVANLNAPNAPRRVFEGSQERGSIPFRTTFDQSQRGLVVTNDALYVAGRHPHCDLLWRVPLDEGRENEPERMLFPDMGDGAQPGVLISNLQAHPNGEHLSVLVNGLLTGSFHCELDPRTGRLEKTDVVEGPSQEYLRALTEGLTIERIQVSDAPFAPGATIIRRADTPLDGNNRLLMVSYPAYGHRTLDCHVGLLELLLAQKYGVVIAAGDVSGGGPERARFQNGKGVNKQASYDDLNALARWLTRERYTSPEGLGLFGNSAGGLMLEALLQQPELWAWGGFQDGTFDKVYSLMDGVSAIVDLNRFEYIPGRMPEAFQKLVGISAYHTLLAMMRDKLRPEKLPKLVFSLAPKDVLVAPEESLKALYLAQQVSPEPAILDLLAGGGHTDQSFALRRQSAVPRWMVLFLADTKGRDISQPPSAP